VRADERVAARRTASDDLAALRTVVESGAA
jgi:hypothetical protein